MGAWEQLVSCLMQLSLGSIVDSCGFTERAFWIRRTNHNLDTLECENMGEYNHESLHIRLANDFWSCGTRKTIYII